MAFPITHSLYTMFSDKEKKNEKKEKDCESYYECRQLVLNFKLPRYYSSKLVDRIKCPYLREYFFFSNNEGSFVISCHYCA